jgi:steroid delta-isomerase-like uncharacterized protein
MNHSLQQVRERIVRTHIEAEERGDWAAALATFSRPRYEVTPTEEVHDGVPAVMAFYEESSRAFPDLSFETLALHPTETGLVHEVILRGTQRGSWRGLPATGRIVRYAVCNVFLFEEDQLVCERMYFDLLTPLRQLGIARDPTSLGGRLAVALNHPLVLGSAALRGLWSRP